MSCQKQRWDGGSGKSRAGNRGGMRNEWGEGGGTREERGEGGGMRKERGKGGGMREERGKWTWSLGGGMEARLDGANGAEQRFYALGQRF